MAYQLQKSDGTLLNPIPDGSLDTTQTGLSFPGPNFVGYGQYLDTNLLRLLENFASNTSPQTTNIQGQIWFNKTKQSLYVFTDQGYKPISGVTVAGTQPTILNEGDIWFNTSTNQTSLYANGQYNLLGPLYTRSQGVSGAIPVTLQDGFAAGVTHNVTEIQASGRVVAIISEDPAFVPATPITGFSTIYPGINFSGQVANPVINSNLIGGVTGDVVGNLTGNVVATTLSGTLTGSVIGNLTGTIVAAATLTGQLIGDFSSTNGQTVNLIATNIRSTTLQATNFSTGNAQIANGAGGFTTLQATNFSSSNILVAGGTASLNSVAATNGSFTNLTVSNLVVSSGSISNQNGNFINLSASFLTASRVAIAAGSITGLTDVSAGIGYATNFSTGNALITGGALSGLTSVGVTGTLTTATAIATNATINNLTVTTRMTATNATLIGSNVATSTATTPSYNSNNSSIATTAYVNSVLPQGVILMWSGASTSIPVGWRICDGNYGTPNLVDRFVVGAGGSYTVGDTGGASNVAIATSNLPAHSHSLSITANTGDAGGHTHTATSSSTSTSTSNSTVNDPGHAHTITVSAGGLGGQDSPTRALAGTSSTSTQTTGISVGVSTATTTFTNTTLTPVNNHQHILTVSGTTGSVGTGANVDIRPPYYALCYIMKLY